MVPSYGGGVDGGGYGGGGEFTSFSEKATNEHHCKGFGVMGQS
jgi:hypothetical protein